MNKKILGLVLAGVLCCNINAEVQTDADRAILDAWEKDDLVAGDRLIKKGVNVNIRGSKDKTLLHWFAYNNRPDTVKLLISKGADINAKDMHGDTALHLALYHALEDGRPAEAAKVLVNEGADVNIKNLNGRTSLHYAVLENGKEIVNLIINKGADVNAKDEDGNTPLHYMAKDNLKSMQWLEGSYTQAHSMDYLQKMMRDIARILIDGGADINAKNNAGQTPREAAVEAGNKNIASLLHDIENPIVIDEKPRPKKGIRSLFNFGKNKKSKSK